MGGCVNSCAIFLAFALSLVTCRVNVALATTNPMTRLLNSCTDVQLNDTYASTRSLSK